MEEIGIALFLITSGCYFLLLMKSFLNWKTNTSLQPVSNSSLAKDVVSVVVAFKDEEDHISDLLESLLNQEYTNYEVILVNDHSIDGSVNKIKSCSSHLVSLFHLPDGDTGKKQALSYGLSKAKGNYVLFTDADCTHRPLWINSMVQASKLTNSGWVGGAVSYHGGKGLSAFFQKLESAYLVMISSFTISNRTPTTCNGANILIKKEVLLDVNGFEGLMHTPSGDDELLMQKIAKKTAVKLAFNYNLHSTVTTSTATTWRELVNQRIRWGSKLKHNLLPYNKLLSALVFLFHLFCLMGVVFSVKITLAVLLLRFLIEWYGGKLFLSQQRESFKIYYFMISFFVYPLYVNFMAILTQFKSFSWKGRDY